MFQSIFMVTFIATRDTGLLKLCLQFQGLSDANNYHEFCRLLARLKSNYQLGELVLVESYPEAIQLIAKFTIDSLRVMLQVSYLKKFTFLSTFFFSKCFKWHRTASTIS